MLRVPNTNLAFIHIPKTAGLAVRAAFGMKRGSSGDHSVTSDEDKALVAGDYVRFCVVRNPLTRFVSAYLYNLDRAQLKPTGVRKLILEAALDRDINDFVAHFAQRNIPFTKYDHFKRQVYYCRLGQPQIILRQERLDTDIKIVAQLAPRQFKGLARKNTAADQDRGKGRDPNLVTELSPASLKLLTEFYSPDFTAFGYPRPALP